MSSTPSSFTSQPSSQPSSSQASSPAETTLPTPRQTVLLGADIVGRIASLFKATLIDEGLSAAKLECGQETHDVMRRVCKSWDEAVGPVGEGLNIGLGMRYMGKQQQYKVVDGVRVPLEPITKSLFLYDDFLLTDRAETIEHLVRRYPEVSYIELSLGEWPIFKHLSIPPNARITSLRTSVASAEMVTQILQLPNLKEVWMEMRIAEARMIPEMVAAGELEGNASIKRAVVIFRTNFKGNFGPRPRELSDAMDLVRPFVELLPEVEDMEVGFGEAYIGRWMTLELDGLLEDMEGGGWAELRRLKVALFIPSSEDPAARRTHTETIKRYISFDPESASKILRSRSPVPQFEITVETSYVPTVNGIRGKEEYGPVWAWTDVD